MKTPREALTDWLVAKLHTHDDVPLSKYIGGLAAKYLLEDPEGRKLLVAAFPEKDGRAVLVPDEVTVDSIVGSKPGKLTVVFNAPGDTAGIFGRALLWAVPFSKSDPIPEAAQTALALGTKETDKP